MQDVDKDNKAAQNTEDKSWANVNRRNLMKKAATVAGSSAMGIGSIGIAAASSHCTTSDSISKDDSYEWSLANDDTNAEGCSGADYKHKVELGAGLLYYGTVRGPQDERWLHFFDSAGHSEGFHRADCYEDWRLNEDGVLKQKSTWDNKLANSTNMPVSNGSDVKANPAIGSSTDEKEQLDVAYAALYVALDGLAWPLGSAMSIAAAALSNDDTASRTDNLVEYRWDYAGNDVRTACGTNNVYQEIRSEPHADDAVKFDQYQEVWANDGVSEIYEGVSFSVSMQDPATSYSLGISDENFYSVDQAGYLIEGATSDDSSGYGNPVEGDIVQDTEGEKIKVRAASTKSRSFNGGVTEEIPVSELPNSLSERYESGSTTTFKYLPLSVSLTHIKGEVR
ncbi:hypothetical protein [Haloparvum sp. AD34]